MATILKVRRLKRNNSRARRNKRPRKMSRLQAKFFGPRKRRTAKRRSNPALVATLGALNPRGRRTTTVARRRRRARLANPRRRRRVNVRRRRRVNPRRTARRRRRNTRVTVVTRRRRVRRNGTRRRNRRSYSRRRRNPSVFGHSITSPQGLKMIGGGLTGVVAAKFIPTMLPVQLLGSLGSSNIGRTVITGVSAVIAGWAAGKVNKEFGEGVLFGGLMQTASVAFNAFLPGLYSSLGIGLGDLMPGTFSVPQNPIRGAIPPPPPANARVTMNGLARAYGSAY